MQTSCTLDKELNKTWCYRDEVNAFYCKQALRQSGQIGIILDGTKGMWIHVHL